MLYGIGDLQFRERPVSKIGKGEALVKVKAAGICGSDIARVFDTGAHRHPLIIGHEFSGTVEKVGSSADADWQNRRVGVFPLIPCGKCVPCQKKQYEMCRNYSYLGSRRDGGFAEYVRVPVKNLIELPENVSFEAAAMLEPMAVAVHAMRRGTEEFTLPRDAAVAVCGLGTIGILLTEFLMDAGYRNLYVVGNKEDQRKRAAFVGVLSGHYCDSKVTDAGKWLQECTGGPDVFFECTGKNEVLQWGIDSVRPAGKVVLVGNPGADMTLGKDIYWKILRNQIVVTGTWNSSFTEEDTDDWNYVMKRMKTGSIVPEKLITHRVPLKRLWEGLEIMHDKTEDYCKIMVISE